MKRLLIFCLVLGGYLSLSVSIAREFTSDDGSKVVEAKYLGYDDETGKVRLLIKNETLDSDLGYFSKADQLWILEQLLKDGKDDPKASAAFRARLMEKRRVAAWSESIGEEQATKVEEAIKLGLKNLALQQLEDGSWPGGDLLVGNTGLVLLAFLGHGEGLEGEFGPTIKGAVGFLLKSAKEHRGFMITSANSKQLCYEHAIATQALVEAYGMGLRLRLEFPELEPAVKMAVQLILKLQHGTSGGWDYSYDVKGARGGDLSITAWHIQALVSAKKVGLFVQKDLRKALMNAEDYVEARGNDRGGFGYTGKQGVFGGYDSLTGSGVYCLQEMGRSSSREARAGIRYLLANSQFQYRTEFCDLYALYWESLAARNRGGEAWGQLGPRLAEELLPAQGNDGSWGPPNGGKRSRAHGIRFMTNSSYRNAIILLALETPYRFTKPAPPEK